MLNRQKDILRQIEEKYYNIFEHAPVGIFSSTISGKLVEVNPEAAHILGYDSPEDIITVVNRSSICEALYVDPESGPAIMKKALDRDGEWVDAKSLLYQKDGDTVDVRIFFRKITGESHKSVLVEGFLVNISEQNRLEFLLRLQRNLTLALGSSSSVGIAMKRLLQGVMQVGGIDAGGVYLLDAANQELRLIYHTGLSSWFVDQVLSYGPETPQMRVAMQGEPVYWSAATDVFDMGDLLEREGLVSLATIPIMFDGRVVAVLNLASRTRNELKKYIKKDLEAIAAGIGGIIARVVTEDALRVEREKLAESNAALRALVQQREEDRREIEDTLLTNIEVLVKPYIEKLIETRLTPDQALLLDVVNSNLTEITSPLLRTLSRQFSNLTPTEIRVASLVKDGRTSKEVACILGVSQDAVLFHRQNVRRKLGLKRNKINLHTYLSSLS